VTPQDALEAAKRAAYQRNLRISTHARARMAERNTQAIDVLSAVISALDAQYDPPGEKWKLIGGKDASGDDLTVVVGFDTGEPRVVTVY
jgi:hypothetical protein